MEAVVCNLDCLLDIMSHRVRLAVIMGPHPRVSHGSPTVPPAMPSVLVQTGDPGRNGSGGAQT